jgi:tetratricopeptide (TPR) repeat protein
MAAAIGNGGDEAFAYLWLAECALAEGSPDKARHHTDRAHALASAAEDRESLGYAERLLGQVEDAEGNAGTARAHFEASLAMLRDAPYNRARTLLAYGATLARATAPADRERGRELMAEAHETFHELGAAWDEQSARPAPQDAEVAG